jgi:hypothetical protein
MLGLGSRGSVDLLGSLAVVPPLSSLDLLDYPTAHELETLLAEVRKALSGQH